MKKLIRIFGEKTKFISRRRAERVVHRGKACWVAPDMIAFNSDAVQVSASGGVALRFTTDVPIPFHFRWHPAISGGFTVLCATSIVEVTGVPHS
jgi:hypothetical protein